MPPPVECYLLCGCLVFNGSFLFLNYSTFSSVLYTRKFGPRDLEGPPSQVPSLSCVRVFVKELVVVKSHQNRTFQTIRSIILNNQNISVSKPHCQDCLSDNRTLDLPKMAHQVSLSDDQIQLFFSRPTVYMRLVNRPSRHRGSPSQVLFLSCVSVFTGAKGRARPPVTSSSYHCPPLPTGQIRCEAWHIR